MSFLGQFACVFGAALVSALSVFVLNGTLMEGFIIYTILYIWFRSDEFQNG